MRVATPDPFGPALQTMALGGWSLFGPEPFQEYLTEHGLPRRDTAQAISVDFLERLAPSLRTHEVMVLRMGQSGGTTRFALVSTPGRLRDFFLHDDEVFGDWGPEPFTPEVPPRSLVAYSVLGVRTETSLVNLAFASGLIGEALGLDRPYPTGAPATGSSTYCFKFRPHSAMNTILEHIKGQVEIDAVFVGRREGQPHLFVVEAKSGAETRTLAKHKLVYPVLAVAPKVPAELPIVPVYLRVVDEGERVLYHVTECGFADPRQVTPALDQLKPLRHRCLELRLR